jgi:hypothetical protein
MDLLTTYTQLGPTSNYSAIANPHNSQITTASANLFQPAVCSPEIARQWLLTVEFLQLHTLKPPMQNLTELT